jgi:iron complex outermembrane receptor protein
LLTLVKSVNFICLFFILLFLALANPISVFAQGTGAILKGKLIYKSNGPAEGLVVRIKRLGNISTTNKDGSFVLANLSPLNDTLIVSFGGQPVLKIGFSLHKNEVKDLGIIALPEPVNVLQTVEISGHRENSYKDDYSFFGNKTQTPMIDIPQAISTVSADLIKDQMDFTLKDAMNNVAGANQYSGFDEYTIRGFRAENARDINGLRGYNTTYTNAMLVNIDRVEVIKGPTATLYGNCDPGGTINLVTKKPLSEDEFSADVYGGAWDHFRAEADATGSLNYAKTLLYRFNAGYDQTKSFQNGFYSKSYEIGPSFSFVPGTKFRVNADFSVSHINSVLNNGQPGINGDPNLLATPISLATTQPGDFLHETDIASNFNATCQLTPKLAFNIGYLNYITQQNVDSHGLNNYITPDSVSLYYTAWTYHTVTNTISNYFTYRDKGSKISQQVVFGYDYIRSTVNLNQQYYELPQFGTGNGIVGTMNLDKPQYYVRPVNTYQLSTFDSDASDVDDDIYHTQGVYMQDDITYGKWKALLSLREEFYKGDDTTGGIRENVFLPRVGIVYSIDPHFSTYATWNNGFDSFEAATSTQIYNAPFKPLTTHLLEAGAKVSLFDDKLSATVALYQLTVENVAVSANVISDPNLFTQQGQNQSRGVEVEAAGNILPNLSVKLSYAYCNALVTKSEVPSQVGTRVENAPLNSSGSWVNYTVADGFCKGLGISLGHTASDKRYTLDSGTNLPGYLVFNGGLHFKKSHYRLGLNIYNITNQTYWIGADNNVNKWPGQPRNAMTDLGYIF